MFLFYFFLLNIVDLTINNNTFDLNFAGQSGTVYLFSGNLTWSGISFTNNVVNNSGSTLYFEIPDTVEPLIMLDYEISNNIARNSGTVYYGGLNVIINNTQFINNYVENDGTGLFMPVVTGLFCFQSVTFIK